MTPKSKSLALLIGSIVMALMLLLTGTMTFLWLTRSQPPNPKTKANQARDVVLAIKREMQRYYAKNGRLPRASDLPEDCFIGSTYHRKDDFRIVVTTNGDGRLVGYIVALGHEDIPDLYYSVESDEFSYH